VKLHQLEKSALALHKAGFGHDMLLKNSRILAINLFYGPVYNDSSRIELRHNPT
jgi:hypothetical protein